MWTWGLDAAADEAAEVASPQPSTSHREPADEASHHESSRWKTVDSPQSEGFRNPFTGRADCQTPGAVIRPMPSDPAAVAGQPTPVRAQHDRIRRTRRCAQVLLVLHRVAA